MTAPSSPLQIKDFRLLWVGRFAAVIATSGIVVIVGYQIYDVARGQYGMSVREAAFLLGMLGFVQFVPLLLLTPLAGLAADRFERRRVAILADALDLLVAAALALVTWLDRETLPILFSLGALHGIARVFSGPALGAIAPNIVPAELIPRAVGLSSIAWQAGSVAGPAAAGLMFAHERALPYAVAALLLAVSCAALAGISPVRPPANHSAAHPVRQMIQGFTFVWNERFLLGCVSLDLFAVLLGGATALLPVFARDILHVGAQGLGQMRAAPALGAAVVALYLSVRPLERNVGAKMLWAVAAFGAATVAFALSRDFLVSLACLVALGAADMVSVFIRSSLVQLNTPDDMRGRVSAISGLAISASNELGEFQSGLAAALLGAVGSVVFGGVGAIIVTAAWAWMFPELLRARTFAPQYRQREPDA